MATASAPAASAERMIVPRLPGSPMRSATTTNDAVESDVAVGRGPDHHGEQPGRRLEVGHTLGDSRSQGVRRRRRVQRLFTRSDELRFDVPPGAHRFGDERGAFDDERPFLQTRTTAPDQAP